ncbi:MAG TPA: hypothetical protein VFC62_05005 [Atopostipes sp.]|nr:hypothetical protein [Atopostipes sp.]
MKLDNVYFKLGKFGMNASKKVDEGVYLPIKRAGEKWDVEIAEGYYTIEADHIFEENREGAKPAYWVKGNVELTREKFSYKDTYNIIK